MYEIWTKAALPYGEAWSNTQVMMEVERGYRLPCPDGCSREIYVLVMSCWHPNPTLRPPFSQVKSRLSEILELLASATADGEGELVAMKRLRDLYAQSSKLVGTTTPSAGFGATSPPFLREAESRLARLELGEGAGGPSTAGHGSPPMLAVERQRSQLHLSPTPPPRSPLNGFGVGTQNFRARQVGGQGGGGGKRMVAITTPNFRLSRPGVYDGLEGDEMVAEPEEVWDRVDDKSKGAGVGRLARFSRRIRDSFVGVLSYLGNGRKQTVTLSGGGDGDGDGAQTAEQQRCSRPSGAPSYLMPVTPITPVISISESGEDTYGDLALSPGTAGASMYLMPDELARGMSPEEKEAAAQGFDELARLAPTGAAGEGNGRQSGVSAGRRLDSLSGSDASLLRDIESKLRHASGGKDDAYLDFDGDGDEERALGESPVAGIVSVGNSEHGEHTSGLIYPSTLQPGDELTEAARQFAATIAHAAKMARLRSNSQQQEQWRQNGGGGGGGGDKRGGNGAQQLAQPSKSHEEKAAEFATMRKPRKSQIVRLLTCAPGAGSDTEPRAGSILIPAELPPVLRPTGNTRPPINQQSSSGMGAPPLEPMSEDDDESWLARLAEAGNGPQQLLDTAPRGHLARVESSESSENLELDGIEARLGVVSPDIELSALATLEPSVYHVLDETEVSSKKKKKKGKAKLRRATAANLEGPPVEIAPAVSRRRLKKTKEKFEGSKAVEKERATQEKMQDYIAKLERPSQVQLDLVLRGDRANREGRAHARHSHFELSAPLRGGRVEEAGVGFRQSPESGGTRDKQFVSL
jgi:hypothetical protein